MYHVEQPGRYMAPARLPLDSRPTAKRTLAAHRDLRDIIAGHDRRIALQIQALETGLEPQLIGQRIAELRKDKEKAEPTSAPSPLRTPA